MQARTSCEGTTDGKLTVVCAWCGTVLQPGGRSISHGICLHCARIFERELESYAPVAAGR